MNKQAGETWDYVIVGAGAAGCVLANRLSASGRHRVLLLEAGGGDRRLWIRVPAGFSRTLADPSLGWRYLNQPAAGCCAPLTGSVLDPADAGVEKFRRLGARPDAVAFAPSEYELYVALPDGSVLALDRYSRSLDDVARMRLPGRARALRVDPLGRMLLARPAAGDSTWLVDLATRDVIGAVPGAWRGDLPAVAPDGTILTAEGADVVAYADSLTVEGRVAGGAHDRWLTAAWDPRRPALQLAAAESSATATPAAGGQEIYVQVSTTSNQAWAESAARDLRAAGMEASVLPPAAGEDFYRVVLGPFPTREAAEATGQKLGRPFYIFTRQGQDHPQ